MNAPRQPAINGQRNLGLTDLEGLEQQDMAAIREYFDVRRQYIAIKHDEFRLQRMRLEQQRAFNIWSEYSPLPFPSFPMTYNN